MTQNLETEKLEVKTAFDVPAKELAAFYKTQYPARAALLSEHWRWLYRVDLLDNKVPLIIELDKKVIGHAGMIPFKAKINGRDLLSQWFVDFALLKEYQRMGAGKVLTKKWMEFCDFHVTFCNYKSLGVFKKMGWEELNNFDEHVLSLIPANQRAFVQSIKGPVRKAVNLLLNATLFSYKKYSQPLGDITISPVTAENVRVFENTPGSGTVRDTDYLSWRLWNAPPAIKEEYFLMEFKKLPLRLLLRLNRKERLLSVLSVSDKSNADDVISAISSAAVWGMDHDFLNLKWMTSDKQLSATLSNALSSQVAKLTFAYFAYDKKLMAEVGAANFDFELLDSDFELM